MYQDDQLPKLVQLPIEPITEPKQGFTPRFARRMAAIFLPIMVLITVLAFSSFRVAPTAQAKNYNQAVSVVSPTLGVSPTSLNLSATAGASNPVTQPITLSATSGTISYTTDISYSSSISNWLTVSPISGTVSAVNPVTSTVLANVQNLAAGTYTATLFYNDSNNATDQATIPVTLTIAPAPSILNVTPSSLNFTAAPSGSTPLSQTINLSTNGSVDFTNTVSYGSGASNWLNLSTASGTVSNTTPLTITANVVSTTLPVGIYTATVSFYNNTNVSDTVKTVNVNYVVGYAYYLPFVANGYNGFTTYLAFQDTGTSAAHVSISYYNNNGTPITSTALTGTCNPVPQYGECLPSNPFSSGSYGTGIILSDQSLAVIVPEATPYGGSAYAVPSGTSSNLIAPFAINGAYGGYVTQLNVANFGDTSAHVTIQFFNENGTPAPITSTQVITLAAHTTDNFDQSAANSGLPGPTATYAGFNGWAQITSDSGNIAAQVLEQNPVVHFAAIANAIANTANAANAPAIFNNAYGNFYTGMNVINPNSITVTVNVSYYDQSTGTNVAAAPFALPAHAVVGIYQGNSSGTGLPTNGLTSGFAGAAVITSTGGGIVVSINENGGQTGTGNSRSATYLGVANGGSTVGLPVISNGGYNNYVTGDTIFNSSNQPISATIRYYNADGTLVTGATESFTITAHASQPFYQGNAGLPTNFYGTAVVTENSGPANSLLVTTNAENNALFYTYIEPNP